MKKLFNLTAKQEKELLKAAKPVVAIFSAINSLQKEIANKQTKNKRTTPDEIDKLKTELKKREQELAKLGKEKVAAGKKATRFLLHYNQHLVEYIVKGYYLGGGKISREELASEGISSLPKAIEKFDLNSKNRFATYGGFWIKQYIQSFINKSQVINQSSSAKEKKTVIYYDSNYQNDDKESKSYSLLDTLHDEENVELTNEQIRHQDTVIQTNNLINDLEKRETILLVRLSHKIKPINLLDIYCLATEEEKSELRTRPPFKKMKLDNKSNWELLQKFSLADKKISSLPLVKKYLLLFTKNYKFSEISKMINKSENAARRLKQDSFKKLKELAKKRNLHFLVE